MRMSNILANATNAHACATITTRTWSHSLTNQIGKKWIFSTWVTADVQVSRLACRETGTWNPRISRCKRTLGYNALELVQWPWFILRFFYSWFSFRWWDGHVGAQNDGKMSLNFYMIIELNSQKTSFAVLLLTNMAAVTSRGNREVGLTN